MENGKILIWDLGNTLLKADVLGFVQIMGFRDFILYSLIDRKNPLKVHELAFNLLGQVDSLPHAAYPAATAQGKVLPLIMCHWFAGTITYDQIKEKIAESLRSPHLETFFSSKREERLVHQTFEVMLNPEKLVRCMKPIKEGLSLLKECAQQIDQSGNKKHRLFILSNWDAHSFKHLLTVPQNEELFSHFCSENMFISGYEGIIKPQPELYKHFIEKYNVNPSNCILIDDQHENIIEAEKQGFKGILIENQNYKKVKQSLKNLNVI